MKNSVLPFLFLCVIFLSGILKKQILLLILALMCYAQLVTGNDFIEAEIVTSNKNYYIDDDVLDEQLIKNAVEEAAAGRHYHLFTHGRPGELLIQGKWMHASEISQWLSKNLEIKVRNINIYGCNFANGPKGKKAVQFIEDALDVNISASNNITGRDGDWFLEIGFTKSNLDIIGYSFNLQVDRDCDDNGIPDSDEYEVIKLDFASGGDGEGGSLTGWNTIQSNTVPTIVNQDGDASSVTVGLTNFIAGSYTENDPADGWPGSANDPYYIPAVDDIYFHGDLNNDAMITFGGLDPTLKYNVRIYSLISDNGGKTQTFNVAHSGGTVSSGAVSQGSRWAASTLEAGGMVFSNLMANGSNELVVTIDPTDPDPFYALNAIVLECQRDLDGDGVSDACDLDDDNDGILDVDEQACTEQLDNPGFDGVPIGSHRYPPEILPGWTLGSGGLIYSATTSQIEFFDEADGSNTFKQTISQAGLEHLDSGLGAYGSAQVIIDLRVLSSEPQTGGLNSFLDVRVGGVLYAQINTGTDNTSPANAIVTYFNGASGNLSTIPIDDRGQGSSGTTPLETWIIDLPASVPSTGNFEIQYDPSSVNSGTVPNDDFELHRASVITCFKDTDLDGIPDYQDLDSDGDGCPDAVEGGGSFTNTSPPLVTDTDIPGGSTGIQDNLGTSSNADGTPTAGTQSVGESANAAIVACPDPCDASASGNPDLDSDNVSDICDLDDDNDGITDEDEGSCVLDTDIASTYTVNMSTQPATTAINGGGPTSGFAAETDTSTPDELSFTTTSPGETSFDNNDPHKHGTIAELDIMLDRDPSETLQDASLSLTTGGFDDGLFLTVNGVTIVSFDQCDWHNLAAVNDVYGDAVNGSSTGTDLWQPWFAEGNPELVFSVDVNGNATVELLVTQNDGVTRTNILDAIPGSTNPIPQVDFEAGVTIGIAYQNGGDCNFAGNGSISPVTAEFSATFCSPLDTDLDGIPDFQDLDSDGDGCPDAVEGGGSFANTMPPLVTDTNIPGGNTSGDVAFNGFAGPVQDNLGTTVDLDPMSATFGVPTAAGSPQSVGTSQTINGPYTCTATNNAPICEGETLQLNSSLLDGAVDVSAQATYLWSSDGSATITNTTDQNPTATGVVNGEVFTVVITQPTGCTIECTVTAAVTTPPTATVTPTATVCNAAGSSPSQLLDFNALVTAGSAGTWTDTDGTGVNLANPTAVDFTEITPNNYTFTYTTNTAVVPCVDQSYTTEVTVNACQPPVATANESLSNPAGAVVQEVILEDDGDGADSDPDGTIDAATVDLDPGTAGIQKSLVVPGEGTWTEDGAGNVTFTPEAGFTNDPTPIDYTINDNDGNTSNTDQIVVDYVPVAADDTSTGNTTGSPAVLNILTNDDAGDAVDPSTVDLDPGMAGNQNTLVVPGEGTWMVDGSGNVTFTPEMGFTGDPTPIPYTVEDDDGNETMAIITVEYVAQPPVATANESLSNPAGAVVQEVILEDDGDGADSDPDGTIDAATVDLDPGTAGIQKSLVVPGEGTWTEDGAGNVTFTPEMGFTNDPTPIDYTINDNDGNTSNTDQIVVDYVPVAADDTSTGNTTGSPAVLNILTNDDAGDAVDPSTVDLDPGMAGDQNTLVVPGEGTWMVDGSGNVTFTPEMGFTGDPTPIPYTVEDDDGNETMAIITVEYVAQPPVATANESLSNPAGAVVQEVILEDDGDGADSDPDGTIDAATVDLDPGTAGIQKSLVVPGEGTWTEDGAGNVTFTPEAGFTNDPTPIDYTINDNDGNTSNTDQIVVDYVPVAADDTSTGNTTGSPAVLNILTNDDAGDAVDPSTVDLDPGMAGDQNTLVVPGEGTWMVDGSGNVTFTPEMGFTGDPTPIPYTVEDDDGNETMAIITVEYVAQPPVATANESLSNPAGAVVQEVILEDDGDGADSDPDGTIDAATVDLDPGTAGIQKSLVVPGEGTWTEDGAGNVTFTPEVGFTNDPTPIDYTINDNDGNTSNTDQIVVDYVPVAADDTSTGNTTGSPAVLNILTNDDAGDAVDPSTVDLDPGMAGDQNTLVVPGEGTWMVDGSGNVTFTPEMGFTGDPTPIPYTVEDDDGNETMAIITVEYVAQPPVATANESLSNPAGAVVQEVILEDDGDGADSDPDGTIDAATVDLDPGTAGIQKSLVVPGEGTWTEDGAGNVTFTPEAGFTNDPTPIDYTINDNDGNTSNTDQIVVDYVPVAADDTSTGNTTGSPAVLNILTNDDAGDAVDPSTVDLDPGMAGDQNTLVVPGEGTWMVDGSGNVTFTPEMGFTGDPTPIPYTVEDDDGNETMAIITVEYVAQPPVATANESLSNPAGAVVQEVILEDDGDGADSDPDGTIDAATVDLDPGTAGIQKSLVVPGEGTWTEDGAGNVTFTPEAGFTNDPTPIDYTINDNDGNTSNTDQIVVDYVPVAADDTSTGNTTGSPAVLNILTNDDAGDAVDPSTVDLDPGMAGDQNTLVVPGEGTWMVDGSGNVTFTPEMGFTGDPTPIPYTVEDDDGNETMAIITVEYVAQPPVATANESLSNPAGAVVQEVILEDDGDGADSDPDGTIDAATVDLDPGTAGIQKSLVVPGEGTWTEDGAGNVTFTPEAGFTNDPTPIDYTINDNDGNTSNTDQIVVDYVPVAADDTSTGNTTGSPAVLNILTNDDAGDAVDPSTVDLDPGMAGDQNTLVVPGEGTWMVDGSGNVTFTPEMGFTGDPTPIPYTVEDDDGNETMAIITVEYKKVELTPQFFIEGTTFDIGVERDGVYSIANIGSDPSGPNAQFLITRTLDSSFELTIDELKESVLVFGSNVAVANADCTYQSFGASLILLTLKDGVVIPAGGSLAIAIHLKATGTSTSTAQTSLQLVDFTGCDVRLDNNFAQGTFSINIE